jgi:hypothetical protein
MNGVNFPEAHATVETLGDAATFNVAISDALTIIKRTGGFGQVVTGLSLTASKDLRIGSKVKVDIAQGATGRNVTFGSAGSSIVATALTGVASDRDVISLTWDGVAFIADTIWQKIFDFA